MDWKLNKSLPLIPQISERLCLAVACGEFKPNQRVLSVREVAVIAGANPNTVQHAFENLESKGVLYSVRGSGWFVCEDISSPTVSCPPAVPVAVSGEVITKEAVEIFKAYGINKIKVVK